jgi:hypothetical protein
MAKSTPDAHADYHRSAHASLDELIDQTHRLYRSITDNARKAKAVLKPRKRRFGQHVKH